MERTQNIRHYINWFAALLALVVVILPPLAHYYHASSNKVAYIHGDLVHYSQRINQFISLNPDKWSYEKYRLTAIISEMNHDEASVRIVDLKNSVIAEEIAQLPSPVITLSADISDYGVKVGTVEISHSMRSEMFNIFMTAGVGLFLGFLIFFPLRLMPQQALSAAFSKLEINERQLQAIMDNAKAVVFLKDRDGRFLFINKQFEELFHIKCADIVGKTSFDLFPKSVAQPIYENEQDVLASGKACEFEELIPQDGSEHVYLSVRAPICDSEGEPFAICGIATDITSIKSAERELSQHQAKLEELVAERTEELTQTIHILEGARRDLTMSQEEAVKASRAKSTFLSTMSHEIRTPLNVVIGFSHLVMMTPLSEIQKDYVDKTHTAASNLLNIINNILDFSKIEAGQMEVEQQPFSLDRILDETSNMISENARQKGLKFSIQKDSAVPCTIIGDRVRLSQILLNLAGNAVKFTEIGQVAIDVEMLEKSEGSAVLSFAVHDSGIGIPAQHQEKLFQSFSQVDVAHSRKFGGTGLGLAICKQLVEIMGGTIQVESQVGVGSTFFFNLPFQTMTDESASSNDSLGRRSGFSWNDMQNNLLNLQGLEILVVEDHEINQELIKTLLNNLGIDVTLASNGRIALAKIEVHEGLFDLILMDLQMPKMNGLQTTEELRQNPRYANYKKVPIIALTAQASTEDKKRCLAIGMNDYITKPIEPELLYEVLELWSKPVKIANRRAFAKRVASPQKPTAIMEVLPGINTKDGLARFLGNRQQYNKVLFGFLKKHQDCTTRIRNHLEQGERQEAADLLHGLKGVSANLGAESLVLAATECETTIRHSDSGHVDLEEFERNLTLVMEGLSTLPREAKPIRVDQSGAVDTSAITLTLETVHKLLKDRNMTVEDNIPELRSQLNGNCVELFEQIVQGIQEFDFEQAIAATVGMAKHFGIDDLKGTVS
jgi:two-component system, sensor histidine kinase and response regulator